MNPAPDQRIPALDGLRGMAALMVVVSHVSNSTGLWGGLLGNGGGQVGVMIFFVLSGYLIGALYLDQPFTVANVWEYAVRRVARVVPAFYAVLSLALILLAVSGLTGWNLTIYPITLEQSVPHYALLSGIGVFWTIPVEMHFYAVFVAAWWLYSRSSLAMIAAAVLVIVVYWSFPVQVPQDPRTLPYYLVFFLIGLLISRAVAMRDVHPSGPLPILAGLGFFLPFLLYPNVYAELFGRSGWLLSGDLQQIVARPSIPDRCRPLSRRGSSFAVHKGRAVQKRNDLPREDFLLGLSAAFPRHRAASAIYVALDPPHVFSGRDTARNGMRGVDLVSDRGAA
jgi:peptidoglycan/LPS O-acetylase OafA/YrhL